MGTGVWNVTPHKLMWASIMPLLLQLVVNLLFAGVDAFDPFMDSKLFGINWLGPLDLSQEEITSLGERHLVVTTDKKESYRCILPEVYSASSSDKSAYEGPDVDEVMKPLFTQTPCSYRIESYWTYELCHGKSLKQYHETREQGSKPKLQEYILGLGNSRTSTEKPSGSSQAVNFESEKSTTGSQTDPTQTNIPASSSQGNIGGSKATSTSAESSQTSLPVREVDGIQMPYYEVVMDGGTRCDLTGQPRKSRIMYVCHREGRGEIYELKESSTCEYDVVVLTALLCAHPSYRPKSTPVSEIRCHAMVGSPMKPSQLSLVEHEVRHLQTAPRHYGEVLEQPEVIEVKQTEPPQNAPVPTKPTKAVEDPQAGLGSVTDRQTLRNILSGGQCLRGGTGWWKHEVCVGSYVRQFHKDKTVEAQIYLGYWDKQKHLQWLNDHPNKRPKPGADRRMVNLFYSGGDVCDLTGKPRSCEVRLKCLPNVKNVHAVTLSLSEPSTCSYVLTVESALFCDVLKHADENGLFDNVDL